MLKIPEYENAQKVFYFFEEISKIPRVSGNSGKIADFLVDFAKARGLWYMRDKANNVIIKKDASKGYENKPALIFQAHTDMVEDKKPNAEIDMAKEGLKIFRDGDFIKAEGTTLGADDGIGMAYALSVLDSNDLLHPDFEAVFTSDEEIGLIGAAALDTSILKGKMMINLDSDFEQVFIVGCAGGKRMDFILPYEKCEIKDCAYRINATGFLGGHSGSEINKGRINAIKAVAEIISGESGVLLSEISGGNADNAIPRFAECTVYAENEEWLKNKIIKIAEKYKEAEPGIDIKMEKLTGNFSVFNSESTGKILDFIDKMPTGVYKMSDEIPGLPETSSNIGIIKTENGRIRLAVSLRSAKNGEKQNLGIKLADIAKDYGADVSERGEYPAWEYKKDSRLCETMKKTYSDMYGKEPSILTIHAGLECGIFSDKIKDFECVSIGPDNFDIHTADERLSISSTARIWEYLKEVLKSI